MTELGLLQEPQLITNNKKEVFSAGSAYSAVKRLFYEFTGFASLDFLRAGKIFMDKPPLLLTINGLKSTA
jgi:hypothetical protein